MSTWKRKFTLGAALAVLALGGVPTLAAETSAQRKDQVHEKEIQARMKARAAKPGGESAGDRAHQAEDAARLGGAKTARGWHGATHQARKGVHGAARKTEKATK